MRIAIVGTGISGLVCAHLLHPHHDAHDLRGQRLRRRPHQHRRGGGPRPRRRPEHHAVDTGFIVYNERNYPNFVRLLDRLGVATQPSDMSFSVSNERTGTEYRGTNLNTLYAQRANLLRPSFHRMLVDILRFNRSRQAPARRR